MGNICVCMCVWEGSRWLQGIGSGWSHVFRGQRCEYVWVSMSVFTGMRVLACRYMLIRQRRQRGWCVRRCPCRSEQNRKTEWSDWLCSKKIAIQIKWRLVRVCAKVYTHCSGKIRHIWQCVFFSSFFLPCLQKKQTLMVECKTGESSKKKYDQRDFFLAFWFYHQLILL